MYGFMTFVWIFRIIIAIVNPCPVNANPWMAYGQLIGSVVIAVLLCIPLIMLYKNNIKEGVKNE